MQGGQRRLGTKPDLRNENVLLVYNVHDTGKFVKQTLLMSFIFGIGRTHQSCRILRCGLFAQSFAGANVDFRIRNRIVVDGEDAGIAEGVDKPLRLFDKCPTM